MPGVEASAVPFYDLQKGAYSNMLNKKWGTTYGNAYSVSPLTVSSLAISADGQTVTPVFAYNANSTPAPDAVASRWHCQVGLRLSF